MKLLPALLTISVVGNLALAAYVLRSPSLTSPAGSDSSAPVVAQKSTTTVATSSTSKVESLSSTSTPRHDLNTWRGPRTDDDLHSLVARMRAAGYPPSVMRAVVNQLLEERMAPRRLNASSPFWKLANSDPEKLAEQQAITNEMNTLREAALGADGTPSASLSDIERTRRYGNLSNEKIDALIRIEREYRDVSALARTGQDKNLLAEMESSQRNQKTIEQEKMADLAAVLTPEELASYEMRTSSSATQLINNLRNTDVSEQEYAALYQAHKALREASPPGLSGGNTDLMLQRMVAQSNYNEQTRAILGDERFYQYLEGSDYQYASVAKFTKQYPNLNSSVAYQLYQLQSEAQQAMMSRSGSRPSPESAAEMRTLQQQFRTRLETLIPKDVVEAYTKQGSGRMFFIPTSTQTGAVPK